MTDLEIHGVMSTLKLALAAAKIREQSGSILTADPIAVVGMSCRVPGADSPEAFWKLLREARDASREVPPDRWDANAWFDTDASAPGKSITKRGGFLDRIDLFDAAFFGILPREAERMDPQQRLLLEVAFEALESAGLPDDALAGSQTGVFIASYHSDYARMLYRDPEWIDARTLTGAAHAVVPNRLSYLLDLRGPSVSIDTACSSSLVATHLACQSLRAGESDIALAGGVSLMCAPELMIAESKVGFMAPDGRCKTFDARADGFGRGEGCGVVVLKRLADAIADGDPVLAVIRGSAVNQDGHSTLLAAPNGLAQQDLILQALTSARVDPGQIGFIEAHGTGTALGDPLEVEALAATVGRPRADGDVCYIGAAKASIGHLEAAAGVVGLIKAVLVLRHGEIPPQANFRTLSPHISLGGSCLAVPTAPVPWSKGTRPRRIGTSGFGVGGTNAHVVLEEAPGLPPVVRPPAPDVTRVLPLSARGPEALRALAERWVDFLSETDAGAVDLAYSATERRTHYDHRLAIIGRSVEQWRTALGGWLRDGAAPGAVAGRQRAGAPRVGFVFSGQGPQWYAMGRELLLTEPVFQSAMEACDAQIQPLAGWSVLEELARPEDASRLSETEFAQPAIFALQVALSELWKSWGIVPDGVVGHSVGEIAALHVAGALSLADAARAVWQRGRIMQEASGLGRMASVALTAQEAEALIRPAGDLLSVAAVNAPHSVVLSGETAALESMLASLVARGVSHRMLQVDYAFHSAQMAPFQQRLVDALQDLRFAPMRIPVYSTVTGESAKEGSLDAAYFGRNVREPVRLASAIDAMLDDGFDAFLEIAPHPVLGGAVTECVMDRAADAVVAASLRRGRSERDTMLQACAALYCQGARPAWAALERAPGQLTPLPTYPWQRSRYWLRTPPVTAAAPGGALTKHPLLGRRVPVAGPGPVVFEGGVGAPPWLTDHRVFGRVLLPAAAVVEAFCAAAGAALRAPAELTGFAMHRPLVVPESGLSAARWQIVVGTPGAGPVEVSLYQAATDDDGEIAWTKVASATAQTDSDAPPAPPESAGALTEVVSPAAAYEQLAAQGVELGSTFRALTGARRGGGTCEAWVELPQPSVATEVGYVVHPVLLDGALLACLLAAGDGQVDGPLGALRLPVGADRVRLFRTDATRLLARARVREGGPERSLTADLTLETPDGRVVAEIEGMRFAPADRRALVDGDALDRLLYRVVWERSSEEAPAGPADAGGEWLLFADRGGGAHALEQSLMEVGGRCSLVRAGTAYAREDERHWTLDPADPAQLERLFAEGDWGERRSLRGIVHLWNLDLAPLGVDRADPDAEDVLGLASLLHLAQRLPAEALTSPSAAVWVVTRGAQVASGGEPAALLRPRAAGAWALADVAAAERPELRVRRVDADPADGAETWEALRRELARGGGEPSAVALRGATRWTRQLRRVAPARSQPSADVPRRLTLVKPGTLDGVALVSAPAAQPGPGDVRLRVLAAGVNLRDVLSVLGMYPGGEVPLGVECVGIVTDIGTAVADFVPGDRVFGYAPGSFATSVVVPAAFLVPAPADLDDVTAAGIPVAYLTAFYGLHRLAGLQAGESVLIHAAAGGVGLAAVHLARRAGAKVFATAGSPEKRAMLRALGVPHVMDSRSLDFGEEIRRITSGAGVDVVLNSLAGDFIAASLAVLGHKGRFLELGKRDIMTPATVAERRPDVSYRAYDLGAEAMADQTLMRPMLAEIAAGLADGSLAPLPTRAYQLDHATDAFRFMAQAKHIGKLVLVVSDSATAPLVSEAATYMITGGLGALGVATARWLVALGARTLVLTGRGAPGAEAATAVSEMEAAGARVRVLAADAGDEASMRAVIEEIGRTLPPLRGVVHAAGVLEDGVLVRQHWDTCRCVLRGKAHGAWLLHELTRNLPLDFFVLYSAAGVLLVAPGQGVYPAANAELDALAQARQRGGLPALSVAWGAWAEGGMAADLAARGFTGWTARGLGTITAETAFPALERLLRERASHAAVMDVDWARFTANLPAGVDPGFYASLAPARGAGPGVTSAGRRDAVATRLRAAPASQRREALLTHLRASALHVLGQPASIAVDASVPLRELGLDSLMAVELRNSLSASTGRTLPATLLFDYPTLDALSGYFMRALELASDEPAAPTTDARTPVPPQADLAGLSEADAAAQLLAELATAPRRRSS
jgi:acyl transferase domain-containing protein/NADPH:quinone reductase-like Zn-dependent oxidoreductase/acyl carrier protein